LSLRATEGDELIRSAENGPEGIELRKPHRLCCQTVKHALGMGGASILELTGHKTVAVFHRYGWRSGTAIPHKEALEMR